MHWESEAGEVLFKAIEFGELFSLHGIFAVLLIFCVAYVCICRPSKTVQLVKDDKIKKRLIREYNILGALMIFLPIFIFIYLSIIGKNGNIVIGVEIAVLVVFARFWWTKSQEMSLIYSNEESATELTTKYLS